MRLSGLSTEAATRLSPMPPRRQMQAQRFMQSYFFGSGCGAFGSGTPNGMSSCEPGWPTGLYSSCCSFFSFSFWLMLFSPLLVLLQFAVGAQDHDLVLI